ncbi:hypothetical protein, conserved [Babesia bigemina]|uniref:Vacuolar-sorting protein SNF8 n=1 Tax=Babesia bigemina TaxID=5866 RepID=A0A061D054_BABBI|nr:hypothetical protein, conserved [Babesia bigemina]CDR94216.1 hypothetical protein, conserved [Babesia bigemina]|eukprot:XP_012766402.1 hypothetical protein, conserved [Babesia bigemina]
MRRGIGASRILNSQKEQWDSFSQTLSEETTEAFKRVADDFKADMCHFVEKYKNVINADPYFRLEFLEMCDLVDFDPLIHSYSSLSRILGLSSFYSMVTMRMLEICIQTRGLNGGLCEIRQVLDAFPKKAQIRADDILISIRECAAFGKNSIRTVRINDKTIIVTTPIVLGDDYSECLHLAAGLKRGVAVSDLIDGLGWNHQKAQSLLNCFTRHQIAWIDEINNATYYWFPCLF